jgi:chromosome partitioning protein
MGQVIAIVSQKGGVGKTTTAINLGACLSAIQRKVLLVGLDPQGGLARCFGLSGGGNSPGMLQALTGSADIGDVIYRVHPRLPRLDLIPVSVASVSDDMRFARLVEEKYQVLHDLLELLQPTYDFIFLDTPSRLDSPTSVALSMADSYLLPIQCQYAAQAGVGNVLRSALELKKGVNPRLRIFGCLITMADRRAAFSLKIVREVRQYLKSHVFRTIIPHDPRVAEIPYRHAPVIAYDMECPGSKAYIRLAREILGERLLA